MRSKWVSEIKGFEEVTGYKIYEDGTVESYWKRHDKKYIISDTPKRILKPMKNKKGYLRVELKGKNYFVHRLVALSFLPNTLNKEQVNHIDCNKTNNNVSNLEWVTNSENHKHKCENGLNVTLKGKDHYAYGQYNKNHHCNIQVAKYSLSGELIEIYPSTKIASKAVGCHPTTITKALKNDGRTAKGFVWKYI